MKKYIKHFKLMRKLRKRMTNINEMMDLILRQILLSGLNILTGMSFFTFIGKDIP